MLEYPVESSVTKIKNALWNNVARDIFFLILIVLLSRILFVFKLGFYSDDWSFLELLYFRDSKIWEWYRPASMLSYYLLYSIFGFSPVGYHLLNTFLFILIAVLLFINLAKLNVPRLFVLTIPLVYILLPHYSTIHFWISIIPINLCLLLFLCSLLADLKALESDFPKLLLWKLLSILAIAVNVLTYELFLPFFYLNLVITYFYYKRLKENNKSSVNESKAIKTKKIVFLLITNFLFIKIALIYKLFFTKTSARMMGTETSFFDHMYWLLVNTFRLDYNEYDYGLNIKQAISTNFADYGIELPLKLFTIFNNYSDVKVFFLSIVITFLIFGYLYTILRKHDHKTFNLRNAVKLILLGITLFGLGYSIFLTNYNIAFTPTGIGNRVSIGAALGIAVIWIGIVTGITGMIKYEKLRNIFFGLSVTFLCVTGIIINNTISAFWVKAYQSEKVVLAEIKNQFSSFPDSSKLMLDGVCPYEGPAIVFESNWDLAGALRILYSKRDLKADIIAPTLKVTDDGFTTTLYEVEYNYPYELLIYNYNEKKIFRISNKEDALKYFESVDSNYNGICPYGHEAHGVKIF